MTGIADQDYGRARLPSWTDVMSVSGFAALLRRLPSLCAEGWEADRTRRFLWAPVLMGVGIGLYFAAPAEPGIEVAAICMVPALIWFACRHQPWAPWIVTTIAALAAVCLGFALCILRVQLVDTPTLDRETRTIEIVGRVVSAQPAEKKRTRTVLDLASSDLKLARLRRVRVSLGKVPENLRAGDWIKVRGVLRPLPPPVAPGSYDFGRKLWFDGIGAVGYSLGTAERIAPPRADTSFEKLTAWIDQVRTDTTERIRGQMDARTGPIAAAFLTGERGLIAEEDNQAMKDSSLAHLLSISGLHMALAGFGFFIGLRFLLALVPAIALNYPVKKWAAVAALIASFGYLILSGASIPTQRSFVMIAIAFVSIIADRPAISMRIIALAAFGLLVVTPEAWIDPSFQMSFAAVAALISAHEWWSARRAEEPVIPGGFVYRALWSVAAVAGTSLIAGLATAPFAAYHFNRFADYGVAANVMATPVVSFVIMPAGVLALLLMPLGLEGLALKVMGWGIGVMLDIAHWVASWPGSAQMVGAMPMAALLLMTAGGFWLLLWQAQWRWLGVPAIVLGLFATQWGDAPDVLVTSDGGNVAVRGGDDALHMLSARRGSFAAEMWLRRDGDERVLREAAKADEQGFRCDWAGCVAAAHGRDERRVLVARSPEALHENCEGVAVLVDQTRGWRRACEGPQLTISKKLLAQEGAIAITFEGGEIDWTSVNRERGVRPWSHPSPANNQYRRMSPTNRP